jgi:Flp pilus assembly protein TadD
MNRALLASIALLLAAASGLARAAASDDTMSAINAARASYEQGKAAMARKDWPAAIRAFEEAARKDPGDAEFQNLLGFSHRSNGNMDAAFRHYLRALELNPRHRPTHEYIGRAYLMTDRPEKAIEHLHFLEKECPEVCKERDMLRQAIDQYPWPPAARMTRSY